MVAISGLSQRSYVAVIAAALLSVSAGTIHVAVMPEHFAEWWGYGLFFLVVALAQIGYGVALLVRPRSSLCFVGLLGTLLIIALWAWTRIVGVPFFGPAAGGERPLRPLMSSRSSLNLP